MFIGREGELAELANEFRAPRASLAIVYGRRRVGKSTLLQHAAERQGKFVYFQATKVDESLNLEAFKAEIARTIGADPLLNGIGDWTGVLHYMARAAELHRGLVVIIDEFPYLLDGKDTLTSIIQKFWDSKDAERGNLKIVLCGSLIAHMEILLSERNPLYGRRTFSLGFGRQVYERQIQPHLSEYMGWAFEQICRDHIRLHAQERFDVPASEIGKIWGPDFDIDIAGSLLDQSRIFGECKWENALVGESIHRDLLENIAKSKFFTEGRTQNTIYFSRKGFTVGLQKLADTDAGIQLIGTDELVKAPAYGWDGPSGP